MIWSYRDSPCKDARLEAVWMLSFANMLGKRNGSLITRLLLCGSLSLLIGLRFLFRRLSSAFIVCHVFRISFKLFLKSSW